MNYSKVNVLWFSGLVGEWLVRLLSRLWRLAVKWFVKINKKQKTNCKVLIQAQAEI